jgi:hypothetical protein
MDASMGKTVSSDYVAKHGSLVTGGVVLNQFKLDEIEDDMGAGTGRFELDTGNTAANVFIEGGFRYRWAWLDRQPIVESLPNSVNLLEDRLRLAREKEILKSREAERKRAELDAMKAEDTNRPKRAAELAALLQEQGVLSGEVRRIEGQIEAQRKEERDLGAAIEQARSHLKRLERDLAQVSANLADAPDAPTDDAAKAARRALELEERTASLRVEHQREDLKELEDRKKGLERREAQEVWERSRNLPSYFSFPSWWRTQGMMAFLPNDWSLRMGFAFVDGADQNAAAIAGSSDLYAELDMGWNLLQWATSIESERAPLRGSVNLEFGTSWATDRDILDVHSRWFLGPAFVFGLPFRLLEDDQGQAAPIAEFIARIGAVSVETPEYLNGNTSEIEVRHGVAEFEDGFGLGFDMEINIPLSKRLGYLMARSKLNGGFDPNPWTLTLGYTIPLSTLWEGLRGGK